MSWFNKILLCGLVFFTGCGYTLRTQIKDVFQNKKGIFIPVFDNKTDEVGAEQIFTNALIREMRLHEELLLINRQPGALELRGAITTLTYNPTVATSPGYSYIQGRPGLADYRRIPSELGVSVTLHLSLIDTETKKVLWEKDFGGFRRVSAPTNRTSDSDAPSSVGLQTPTLAQYFYPEVAQLIARDVYDDMIDFF